MEQDNGILGILAPAFLSRSIINTANRFIYPFAPVISRGIGVPLTAVTSVIALNQATNLLGLFVSPLADKTGYRRMMVTGLLALAAGMLMAGTFPFYYTLVIAMFLSGLCKSIFDPAIQAYVSKRVSYKRRGMVVGILEISWSVATLLGIPGIGILINYFGWRSPFFALAGGAVISLALILNYVKDDFKQGSGAAKTKAHFLEGVRHLLKIKRARGAIGVGFCMGFANDNLFVIYGAWLESAFDLSVVALGMGTGVIGVAELMGSSFTAAFSDRIGIKLSVAWGITFCSVAYLLIPLAGGSLTFALAALFVVFLFYEQSIVAFISLCTELVPGSRATMISLLLASSGLGRVMGAFSGGLVWQHFGMGTVCLASTVSTLMALVFLIWGTRGWAPE
ncbi:putative major facilitator transport protein (MFS superfamily) [Desulforapulum autotrophicum HRM2]|uniref:Major facilitator transport protein (MFS superfamily) n=1 Tax=Desulforapulum autotrophicum (strain ATCC 43914 / DSM 3382 / VKM B-1955 / HRM2) TaxID=177437 RepID=C0QIP6_DESAH|nr:MFS transporter [Desulforapulum autotrophicum]ACN17990.1 putative major facilitator transport protein (MFS superfamily) [Desulforapulum autotrophicum HRM2]